MTKSTNVHLHELGLVHRVHQLVNTGHEFVNTVDNKGRTPLYIASMAGHLEAVRTLVHYLNTDVNIGRRINGGTAFSIASEKSHFGVLEALILSKNSQESKGWCIDMWTNPCKRMEYLAAVTETPTKLLTSCELNFTLSKFHHKYLMSCKDR